MNCNCIKIFLFLSFQFFFVASIVAQKRLPFRIAPYEKNNFKSCIENGRPRCKLDTFEYSGVYIDLNFYGSTSIGSYRNAGRKGAGFGMGMDFGFQPLSRIPFAFHGNFSALYTDIKNYNASIPVLLNNSPNNVLYMPVKANIKTGIYNMNIGARLWLPTRYYQPYVMAMIGFISPSTEVRIYEEDALVWAGIKDKGLLYDYSRSDGSAGNRLLACGLSYNAGYFINIDFRVSWIHSKNYNQITSGDLDQWNFNYEGTSTDFNPDKFKPEKVNMKINQNSTAFNLLLFSIGITFFAD